MSTGQREGQNRVTLQLVVQRSRQALSRVDSSRTQHNLSLELKDQVCDLPEKLQLSPDGGTPVVAIKQQISHMIARTTSFNMPTPNAKPTPTSLICFQAFTAGEQEPSLSSSIESKDHISDFMLSEENKVQSGNAYEAVQSFEVSPKKLNVGTSRPGQRLTLGEGPDEASE